MFNHARTRQAVRLAIDHLMYFRSDESMDFYSFKDKWGFNPADSEEVIKRLKEALDAG